MFLGLVLCSLVFDAFLPFHGVWIQSLSSARRVGFLESIGVDLRVFFEERFQVALLDSTHEGSELLSGAYVPLSGIRDRDL